MRHLAILGMTMVAIGAVSACSDDGGDDGTPVGGTAGMGGTAGSGGAAGSGGGAGMGGGGASGGGPVTPPVPPTPALPANAPTVACPALINGSLDASDGSQTGRHSRIAPVSACGMTKGFPGNAADPSNPHLFDVYRFANPTAAPVCFSFTLSYGATGVIGGGLDAGPDAASPDAGAEDAGVGDAGGDAGGTPGAGAAPQKYMTAYGTFYPTDLSLGHLGDVGDALTSPQAMGITVPAGGTIDVVVYAIDVGPAGVGSYLLSCSTQ